MDIDIRLLLEKAAAVRANAYTPYSHFSVGAALLAKDGSIYQGCNIENASYPAGNCAERTAVFKAVSEGKRSFLAIAIVGGKEGRDADDSCPPCGICRQVLREFTDPKTFRVILGKPEAPDKARTYRLEELLPVSFGPENL
jgi:cytidine deaminase